MPTQTGSIDLKAAKAAADVAKETNQYFWTNTQDSGAGEGAGAHVTEITRSEFVNDPANGGGNALITSTGMKIRDGITDLSTFGADGIKIGQNGNANLSLFSNGFKGTGADGAQYFEYNATGASIQSPIVQNFGTPRVVVTVDTSAGEPGAGGEGKQIASTTTDISNFASTGTVCSVEGTELSVLLIGLYYKSSSTSNCTVVSSTDKAGISLKVNTHNVTIGTDKTYNSSATIELSQTTTGTTYLTLYIYVHFIYQNGQVIQFIRARTSSNSVGLTGNFIGGGAIYTTTINAPLMSFGTRPSDDGAGVMSSVLGQSLYASGDYQTSIGKFNVNDTTDTYSFIIGNGSSNSSRSNALTVDWSGNVNIPSGASYKINGTPIGSGAVSGVKGDAESTYRTGNVNITPANVGAVPNSDVSTTGGASKVMKTDSSGNLTTGLLKSTKNSNTVTIGSQNSSWCHIYNSADIPFIFNKTVATTAGDLGTSDYKWGKGYFKGQLFTSFKDAVAMGSYETAQTTVDGFVGEVRYSSGCMGSVQINTAYTKNGTTIPTGWYNFIYSPHRSGGNSGAAVRDNCDYGTLILSGMTTSAGPFFIQFNNGAIQSVKLMATTGGWVLAGSATGTNTVTISDSNASEVYVKVNPSGSAVYTSTIMRADLQSVWYVGGYYYSSTDYGIVNLNVSNNNLTFQLRNVRQGGSDVKSSSTLTVYYR